jgi:methyl-accepting chemotaxis protein
MEMMVLFNNFPIGRKLMLAFGTLTLMVAAMAIVVVLSLARLESADGWNTHTYIVLGKANAMLDGMINQETGLRGYLVSGEDKFLEPYRAGYQQFSYAFDELKNMTSDNLAQQ